MTCYRPLNGWRSRSLSKKGKRTIVFRADEGFLDQPMQVPCGICPGCKLERSRQWAVRCMHEASCHEKNCFITLTYAPEHLPADGSLDVRVFQKFMKRLRKRFGEGIRFYHCGEYGDRHRRPHYHAIIFNLDFEDKTLFQVKRGVRLYTSKVLEDIWGFGFVTIGEVTFESAAYVARYVMKKQYGVDAWKKYADIDWSTGEIERERKPEYTTMSRRPGIGATWFSKYKGDVYPLDAVVVRGRTMKPPKYYDGLFEHDNPEGFADIKKARILRAKKDVDNSTQDRLNVREQVKLAQISTLKRTLDKEC